MASPLYNLHGCRAVQNSSGTPMIYVPNTILLEANVLQYGQDSPIPPKIIFDWQSDTERIRLKPATEGVTAYKYKEGFRFAVPKILRGGHHRWNEYRRYKLYWTPDTIYIQRCAKCYPDAQAPTEPDAPPKPDTQTKTATTIHTLEPIHEPAFLRILARGHETYSEEDRRTILGVLARWDKTKDHVAQYNKWVTTLLNLPGGPGGLASGYRTEVRLRIKDILKIILRNAIELAQKEL